MSEQYNVKLDTFEGPLDLLLHLVNQLEIDIYDIPVSKITDQYMHYIHTMKRIELNIASEYLVMAATLLAMKSAMLLPKKEIEEIDDYEEDPREQLIARLIEYRKYKVVAETLKKKELEENQLFTRSPAQFNELKPAVSNSSQAFSLYDLLDALDDMFKRRSWHAPLETTVNRMEIPIEDRMQQVMLMLKPGKEPIPFDQLFPYPEKKHIVTTFLAILHLLKDNQIFCEQKAQFEMIFVSRMEA